MESIYFSNSWEDQKLFAEKMDIPEKSTLFAIASGGDTVFNLLQYNPTKIIVTDVLHQALYLVELKKLAIKEFNREDCIDFLGYNDSSVRLLMFDHLMPLLSENAREYWKNHLNHIDHGIAFCGQFEQFIHLFSQRLLPIAHSQKTISELLTEKSEEDQANFYSQKWNTRLWRILFKIFFSNKLLNTLSADAPFKSAQENQLSQYIFNSIEKELVSSFAFKNNLLRFALFETIEIPDYLSEEKFGLTQEKINKIVIDEQILHIQQSENDKFNAFFLSNSTELLNEEEFSIMAHFISNSSAPNAPVYYSHLLSNRTFSNIDASKFELISMNEEIYQLVHEKCIIA